METEFETFFAWVRSPGSGEGKEITIEKRLADFIGLKVGDRVKVMIKKVSNESHENKKEEAEEDKEKDNININL